MKFAFAHNSVNVLHLQKSLEFYKKALDLVEVKRIVPEDGSFILVFLGDGVTLHRLELTWLRDRKEAYDLGDNEMHLAFTVDDYEAAFRRHQDMGIVCFENPKMGIYFIEDPDHYWLEIVPLRN